MRRETAVATTAKAKSRAAKSDKSAPTPHEDKVRGVEVPVNTRKHNQPEYGSDAVAALLNRYGFDYVFLNPGSSYRGLQDSLVNYNGNVKPKCVLGLHEDVVTAMAQ